MKLVLRLSALGDVIHTIPAVCAMQDRNDVAWVVEAPYAELVETVTGVRAIPVRMKKWASEPRQLLDAARTIRGAAVSIDFQGLVKSAMWGRLSGARRRIGFAPGAIREKAALLFTNRWVKVDTARHVVEQNMELAGVTARGEERWDLFPRDPESKLAAFRDAVVLLPGAGKADKIWPAERFRELAKRLDRVVTVWGPGEKELAERIEAPMTPPTNLRELAFVLKHARVVIGADTGPLHLAAALGTKVVGLYGPTNPRRNGPYGQLENCVNRFETTKLMDSIAVQEVMTMLERVVR
jgi:heptosyltransferase I